MSDNNHSSSSQGQDISTPPVSSADTDQPTPPPQNANPRPPQQNTPGGLRVLKRAIPTIRSLYSREHGESVQYHGKPVHLVISAVILTVLITLIISVPLLPGQVELQPGTPATQDIFSPIDQRYESKVLTEKARDQARNAPANEVWVQDSALIQQNRTLLQNNLSTVETIRLNLDMDPPVQPQRQPVFNGITVTEELLNALILLPTSDYMRWRDDGVLAAYDANMQGRRARKRS